MRSHPSSKQCCWGRRCGFSRGALTPHCSLLEQRGEAVCLAVEVPVSDGIVKVVCGSGVRVGRGLRLEGELRDLIARVKYRGAPR